MSKRVTCECCEEEFYPKECPGCLTINATDQVTEVLGEMGGLRDQLDKADNALTGLLVFMGFPTTPNRVNIPELQRLVDALRP